MIINKNRPPAVRRRVREHLGHLDAPGELLRGCGTGTEVEGLVLWGVPMFWKEYHPLQSKILTMVWDDRHKILEDVESHHVCGDPSCSFSRESSMSLDCFWRMASSSPASLSYRCLWTKTLLVREPLPRSPAAETALHTLNLVLWKPVFLRIFSRGAFHSTTSHASAMQKFDACHIFLTCINLLRWFTGCWFTAGSTE